MSPDTKSTPRSRWPLAIGLFLGLAAAVAYLFISQGKTDKWVIPAEFEKQQALLLAWEKLPRYEADMKYLLPQRQALADIIAASYKTVPVVVLVSDDESRQSAMEALSERDVPLPEITLVDIPFDSLWIRDYGPVCVRSPKGQAEWRHHQYEMTARGWTDVDGSPIGRPQDAVATEKLAHLAGLPSLNVPLVLFGGGLASNGEGLVLVSSDIVNWNKKKYDYSEAEITSLLEKHYGARQVIYLDPLREEPTGHLDFFATFVATDTVVIGHYPPDHDFQNAQLLNSHAKRLAGIETSRGPLKVTRITMAPHDSRFFGGTYTNVVFANGSLLVPSYGIGQDLDAVETYQRLLPDWNIIPIDCGALIIGEGAAHCVTLNLQNWPGELIRSTPPDP